MCSVIWTFQISEHLSVPTCSDNWHSTAWQKEERAKLITGVVVIIVSTVIVLLLLLYLIFQVIYRNHSYFGVTGKKGRPSPVRIFSNLNRPGLILPKGEGYWYCKDCQKYSAQLNAHCYVCATCTSKVSYDCFLDHLHGWFGNIGWTPVRPLWAVQEMHQKRQEFYVCMCVCIDDFFIPGHSHCGTCNKCEPVQHVCGPRLVCIFGYSGLIST